MHTPQTRTYFGFRKTHTPPFNINWSLPYYLVIHIVRVYNVLSQDSLDSDTSGDYFKRSRAQGHLSHDSLTLIMINSFNAQYSHIMLTAFIGNIVWVTLNMYVK